MTLTPQWNEKELLIKLREGDVVAFEKLYNFYKTHIITHLLYLFKDDDITQDVAQEVFITIWEKRKSLSIDKSFKSYLYTIATNKAYDLIRKAKHNQNLYAALTSFLDESSNVVDEYLQQKEYAEQLQLLLSKMPEQQRKIYKLYDEIAKMNGISRHTVNTYIKRSNVFLKQQILDKPELFSLAMALVIHSAPAIYWWVSETQLFDSQSLKKYFKFLVPHFFLRIVYELKGKYCEVHRISN